MFPGALDVHTHIDTTFGNYTTVDDWHAGSIGAVCGGTTTIIDFALQAKGESHTFEGLGVRGAPEIVMSRGRVLVRNREYVGGEGGGEFLPRGRITPP